MLKTTLENPLDCEEIKPISPNGNQPWIRIGKIDAEAEAPIPWSPGTKSRYVGKDPDAGKDWGQEEKRAAEDKMVTWHHQLNGHEFQQTQIWANSNEFEQKLMEDRGAWCAAISGVMTSYWTATATTLSKKPCGLPTAGKRNLRKKAEVGVKVSSFSLTTVKQTLICITKLVLMKLRTFVQVPCHSLVMGKTCVKP